MKATSRLSITFLFVSSLISAFAEQAVFEAVNQFNGARYRSVVTERDLANTPKWEEKQDFPPLSPRRAESVARVQLRTAFPAIQEWQLVKFSLRRAGNPDNWIYIVEMKPPVQKQFNNGQFDSIEVVVLMDGRSITPKEEKGQPKALQLK